jgi:TetR/AcrR family transcriptional regulator, mexJK operon transcriptional repressor
MPSSTRRAGRLTREEAARRAERVVEVAGKMFLERGFEATSMEAVAEKAGIAKPTLYAWYGEKSQLFRAVLTVLIEEFLAPLARQDEDLEGTDVHTTLVEIGRRLLAVVSSPEAAAVARILGAQAERFPELERYSYEKGWLAAVKMLARVLMHYADRKEIIIDDPELAADLFLNLVLGRPARIKAMRHTRTQKIREQRVRTAVRVFLEGVRVR